jgi:hypothetical protein
MITTVFAAETGGKRSQIMKARRAGGGVRARGGAGFYDAVASVTWGDGGG